MRAMQGVRTRIAVAAAAAISAALIGSSLPGAGDSPDAAAGAVPVLWPPPPGLHTLEPLAGIRAQPPNYILAGAICDGAFGALEAHVIHRDSCPFSAAS